VHSEWQDFSDVNITSPGKGCTWPHLRCDVGLEEGEHRENCLCLAVLCTIIMVHKEEKENSDFKPGQMEPA